MLSSVSGGGVFLSVFVLSIANVKFCDMGCVVLCEVSRLLLGCQESQICWIVSLVEGCAYLKQRRGVFAFLVNRASPS